MKNDYKQKYYCQRNSSLIRNIDWQFTFETWMLWWGDDINRRGRTRNSLVMCRYKDVGPYSPSNCYKGTPAMNRADCMANQGIAIKQKLSNRNKKPVMTPAGLFPSRREAARHYGVHFNAISAWRKTRSQEFYYVEAL